MHTSEEVDPVDPQVLPPGKPEVLEPSTFLEASGIASFAALAEEVAQVAAAGSRDALAAISLAPGCALPVGAVKLEAAVVELQRLQHNANKVLDLLDEVRKALHGVPHQMRDNVPSLQQTNIGTTTTAAERASPLPPVAANADATVDEQAPPPCSQPFRSVPSHKEAPSSPCQDPSSRRRVAARTWQIPGCCPCGRGRIKGQVQVQFRIGNRETRMGAANGKGYISKHGVFFFPEGAELAASTMGLARDVTLSRETVVEVKDRFVQEGKATFIVSEDLGGDCKAKSCVMLSKMDPYCLRELVQCVRP